MAVANVLLEPVVALLARLDAGEAITSGYLAGELPVHPGWRRVAPLELDGWAADRCAGSLELRHDPSEVGTICRPQGDRVVVDRRMQSPDSELLKAVADGDTVALAEPLPAARAVAVDCA